MLGTQKKAAVAALLLGIPFGMYAFTGRMGQTYGFDAMPIQHGGNADFGSGSSASHSVGAVAQNLVWSPGISIGERIGRKLFGPSESERLAAESSQQAARTRQVFAPPPSV
jgi:hypothetical protein